MSMTERVRDAARAQPFQPFEIVLVDVRRFKIPHPDWLAFPPLNQPNEFIVFDVDENDNTEFHSRWIDENLVIEINPATRPSDSRPDRNQP